MRTFFSDSSDIGWGAIDPNSGLRLQDLLRTEWSLHINIKELKAAIAAVRSLAKPGENVIISVDNKVAYSYLKKAGEDCLTLTNCCDHF